MLHSGSSTTRDVIGASIAWGGFAITLSNIQTVCAIVAAMAASTYTCLMIFGWVQHYRQTGRMWISRQDEQQD